MSNIDLHFHSTYSDGNLPVSELALIIKEKKLDYCALADHHSVDGIRELIQHLNGSGIKVIPATEITTKDGENEVHVLAYDFDIDVVAEIFRDRNEIMRQKKIEEMEAAIILSKKEGLEVTQGLAPNEQQPVTLTIALDVCAQKVNQDLFLKKFGKKFVPEDVYYQYQAPGKSCAVERSGMTVEWVVEKFKRVAQDLIIAHPFVSVSVVTNPLDEASIVRLLQKGLTGIEVYHNDTSQNQIEILKKIVRERSLYFTGGSDFHGKEKNTPIGQYGLDKNIPDFHLARYGSVES